MQNSFLPGHGEGNCRVTNPTDVTEKKGAKKNNSTLSGHGESDCRVTNPTDVTDKKRCENAKQLSTWPWRRQLPRDQSCCHRQKRCEKVWKCNGFLPGHGEGNCRVINPTDVTDKKRRERGEQFSNLAMEKAFAASYWRHRQKRRENAAKTVFYLAMEKAIAAWPILTSQRNLVVSPSGRLTSQSRKVGWKNISDPSDLQRNYL